MRSEVWESYELAVSACCFEALTGMTFPHSTQLKKQKEDRHTQATDDLLFHEAFTLLKKVMNYAAHDTVEAMQTL